VDRALQAGIDRILVVGSDLSTSRAAIACARTYEAVYAAVGLHPHEADTFLEDAEELEALLDDPNVVAVGEIGLDYVRSRAARDVQLRAFVAQLQWARERGLPVSVHNREADDDVLRAVSRTDAVTVLHCFTSPREIAERALAAGHMVSFAGNLTFKRSDDLRATAASLPLDRVLVESDSPVLAPQGRRGKRNEPAFVAETLGVLADLHGVPATSLAGIVSRTADQIFDWRAR
jgi:TatD DNase family protein